MEDIIYYTALFLIGVFSGIINVVAGGGSSFTLPALIFFGLDSVVANGTNRIAVVVQNIAAVTSFRNEKIFLWQKSLKLSLLTLPGTIIGAIVALRVDDKLFDLILGIIMIGIVITMIIPTKKKVYGEGVEKISFSVYLVMFAIGFYGGFIQVGVGFMIMAALHYMMKMNLLIVNVHKVFIVLFFTLPALIVFIIAGNVNWLLGSILALGNGVGAWWAAKHSVKRGEKFIKVFMIVAILIMAAKLLNVF
jgi:uncharacterized protein